jgi:hypothetical protein
MNTNELKLCIDIYKAELGGGDRPTVDQRLNAARAVMLAHLNTFDESFFPYTIDDIERWALTLRKNKDTQAKVKIAIAHGYRCFWEERGKGPCSEEIEAGHIVPRCRGGELTIENCWIECRAHNNQRRDRSIEDYMASEDMTTQSLACFST